MRASAAPAPEHGAAPKTGLAAHAALYRYAQDRQWRTARLHFALFLQQMLEGTLPLQCYLAPGQKGICYTCLAATWGQWATLVQVKVPPGVVGPLTMKVTPAIANMVPVWMEAALPDFSRDKIYVLLPWLNGRTDVHVIQNVRAEDVKRLLESASWRIYLRESAL